jgi:hypothetical protein
MSEEQGLDVDCTSSVLWQGFFCAYKSPAEDEISLAVLQEGLAIIIRPIIKIFTRLHCRRIYWLKLENIKSYVYTIAWAYYLYFEFMFKDTGRTLNRQVVLVQMCCITISVNLKCPRGGGIFPYCRAWLWKGSEHWLRWCRAEELCRSWY